ncbi:hypothetical protein B1R27_00130 [Streptomyces sp. GKU 895]|nr:hypothetical protein B1R27_00130 [Streptomyces sp. GKU 895]
MTAIHQQQAQEGKPLVIVADTSSSARRIASGFHMVVSALALAVTAEPVPPAFSSGTSLCRFLCRLTLWK